MGCGSEMGKCEAWKGCGLVLSDFKTFPARHTQKATGDHLWWSATRRSEKGFLSHIFSPSTVMGMFDMPVTFIMKLTYMMGRQKKKVLSQEHKTTEAHCCHTRKKSCSVSCFHVKNVKLSQCFVKVSQITTLYWAMFLFSNVAAMCFHTKAYKQHC